MSLQAKLIKVNGTKDYGVAKVFYFNQFNRILKATSISICPIPNILCSALSRAQP